MTLTPSDRVRIISEIGRRLGASEWTLIDLTLGQFGLPTLNWSGSDRQAYVMRRIEDGDDDVLLSLGRHLGYDSAAPFPRTEPAFWKSSCFRLFISHLARHRRFAADLQDRLLCFASPTPSPKQRTT